MWKLCSYKISSYLNMLLNISYISMQSTVLAIVNPSVCPSVRPSVRHTLALCQNDSSYDHAIYTVG